MSLAVPMMSITSQGHDLVPSGSEQAAGNSILHDLVRPSVMSFTHNSKLFARKHRAYMEATDPNHEHVRDARNVKVLQCGRLRK